ncbi:CLUMA_CG014944, isoform A [Clunio marinus]|uniref:CLUMA_CG014944, isoform A n=1 Tax=Clunio marinus TaxID=568069 RepID=A0A1J1INI8_9DIPT|nr:CLUMA_CG014944, isoform A [Clunio marinus]
MAIKAARVGLKSLINMCNTTLRDNSLTSFFKIGSFKPAKIENLLTMTRFCQRSKKHWTLDPSLTLTVTFQPMVISILQSQNNIAIEMI